MTKKTKLDLYVGMGMGRLSQHVWVYFSCTLGTNLSV